MVKLAKRPRRKKKQGRKAPNSVAAVEGLSDLVDVPRLADLDVISREVKNMQADAARDAERWFIRTLRKLKKRHRLAVGLLLLALPLLIYAVRYLPAISSFFGWQFPSFSRDKQPQPDGPGSAGTAPNRTLPASSAVSSTTQPPGSPTTAVTPSCAITLPELWRDDGLRYARESTRLECILSNHTSTHLWVLIKREGVDEVYRQGPLVKIGTPGSPGERWMGQITIGDGTAKDVGKRFEVRVVAVPPVVSDTWEREYRSQLQGGVSHLAWKTEQWIKEQGASDLARETFVVVDAKAAMPVQPTAAPSTTPVATSASAGNIS